MKIAKGHYVPKELITSEVVHEAVVKCFVAAGFRDCRPEFGKLENYSEGDSGLGIYNGGHDDLTIMWGIKGGSVDEPITIQQLFTAENGLQWPDWAVDIRTDDHCVWFDGVGRADVISGDWSPVKSRVLATRQPNENKVKTIEDAVIELGGVFPKPDGNPNSPEKGVYYCGKLDSSGLHLSNGIDKGGESICNREEFESAAKRLGYISGYRWGVEYPTNGKRPDLPDDVLVEVNINNHHYKNEWSDYARRVGFDAWGVPCFAFKITDPRYKPADTSYLNASTQAQSLTHSEEGLTHSDWHEIGDRPPIGTMVDIVGEGLVYGHGESGEVVGYFIPPGGKNLHGVNIVNMSYGMGCFCSENLRPAKTDREKFQGAALGLFKSNPDATLADLMGMMFDTGFTAPKADK